MIIKTIVEPQKEIPVLAQTDVLIVGGGPAGLSAAIASARTGAKTLLVERYGCLGGTLTQVGVESFAWYRHEGTIDCEGIGREFEMRAMQAGFSRPEPQSISHVIDTEGFKHIADQILLESGASVLLHTLFADVLMDGDLIKGIIVEGKSGRQAILAERVVDCTGDADVAAAAKVPYTKRQKDQLMGVTVMFHCAGIDVERFQTFVKNDLKPTYADWGKNWTVKTAGKEDHLFSPYLEDAFSKAQAEGIIPEGSNAIAGTWSTFTNAGEACGLNMVYCFGYDATDVWDLTKAEIKGRQQALWAIDALRHYIPGFENAKLRNFGMTLGTRESRQIIGEKRVNEEYVLGEGRCEDSIGIFPEFIDGSGYLIIPTTGRYYQIPYGCLLPLQVENLLVAGRCISADVIAHTSMRNMMCCTVTGQGAGIAAAISFRDQVKTRNISIKNLQTELIKQGVKIL
ncbi:dihydrolipoamide dehydrogenase [Gammaproteobacteria bacterium]|nr:dihydrolipoamide dehydrogenase [Gammaproteobacteria bacterium]